MKVRLYDETAEIYHRRYQKIQRIKYQALVPYLKGSPLLDVGFGTGIGLNSVLEQAPIVGIDGACEMLRVAKKQIQRHFDLSETISLVCAVADALPFRNQVFPLVVSVTVLQNLVHPVKGIQELFRTVTPAGTLALTVLSRMLPAKKLIALVKGNVEIIAQLENLAGEDFGLILKCR